MRTLYEDPNRVINAKDKLHDLKMKPSDHFQSFLSDFTYLADEAGLAKEEWKEELYRKLYAALKQQLIRESYDPDISFERFGQLGMQTANRLNQIYVERNAGRSRAPAKKAADKPTEKEETGTLKSSERQSLMKEGKCFHSKEKRHISSNCPRRTSKDLKTLEEYEENDEEKD